MFLVIWTEKEKIINPYWTGSRSCIEPEHLVIVIEKHAIIDIAEHLVLYKDYKDVEFFEVSRQIFPRFTKTVKVEF